MSRYLSKVSQDKTQGNLNLPESKLVQTLALNIKEKSMNDFKAEEEVNLFEGIQDSRQERFVYVQQHNLLIISLVEEINQSDRVAVNNQIGCCWVKVDDLKQSQIGFNLKNKTLLQINKCITQLKFLNEQLVYMSYYKPMCQYIVVMRLEEVQSFQNVDGILEQSLLQMEPQVDAFNKQQKQNGQLNQLPDFQFIKINDSSQIYVMKQKQSQMTELSQIKIDNHFIIEELLQGVKYIYSKRDLERVQSFGKKDIFIQQLQNVYLMDSGHNLKYLDPLTLQLSQVAKFDIDSNFSVLNIWLTHNIIVISAQNSQTKDTFYYLIYDIFSSQLINQYPTQQRPIADKIFIEQIQRDIYAYNSTSKVFTKIKIFSRIPKLFESSTLELDCKQCIVNRKSDIYIKDGQFQIEVKIGRSVYMSIYDIGKNFQRLTTLEEDAFYFLQQSKLAYITQSDFYNQGNFLEMAKAFKTTRDIKLADLTENDRFIKIIDDEILLNNQRLIEVEEVFKQKIHFKDLFMIQDKHLNANYAAYID
ncbi:UNKNOWN [Stylonychia lemnae]|uniref:Uncharacterized protein n=1 Tax=Stylonychia lemnae TaxID=5949 RepID=A0A077ZYI8_STYLE|nr:UNKNOWN [Stylonychia lemnae]|eukprot:CDW74257.1 UNKNOWN [Stylonychia lemnae]